jgi:hypothetical protein
MNMVGDQGPGITGGGCFMKDSPETNEEVLVILRTLEDRVSVNPSDNDMMESSGGINAGFAGHGKVWHEYKEMSICHQRPLGTSPRHPHEVFSQALRGAL